jgi:hypothetical protein
VIYGEADSSVIARTLEGMVMPNDARSFYEAIIAAGAILSGFCGTFLAFRIQREANYYRQPVLNFERQEARDVPIKLTHFSAAFLLLLLGSVCSVVFGFLLPLLALGGWGWMWSRRSLVVAGLVAAMVLIGAYFVAELVHYEILSGRLLNDRREWGRELGVAVVGIVSAIVLGLVTYAVLAG